MFVITRKLTESVIIDGDLKVTVLKKSFNVVKLSNDVPQEWAAAELMPQEIDEWSVELSTRPSEHVMTVAEGQLRSPLADPVPNDGGPIIMSYIICRNCD